MYSANTSLRKFEAVGSNKFFQKRCSVVINQISIISQMGTPCEFEFGESEGCHLFVPWAGYRRMEFDGEQYDINAGLNAVIYPNMRRSFKSNSDSSAAVLSVNKDHINHIISNRTDRKIQTENFSHLINIDNSFKKNKLTAFFTICNFTDSQVENQDALVYLGVDDLICRWVAWCVSPPGDEPIPRIEMTRTDVVCDLVRASIDRPLTLTEMEYVSGLSARALQYAFKIRFGCSPMQWQRNERLLGAMQRILSMAPGETITTIAYSMGFSSSSAFTFLYRRQFGVSGG
jgi:AraC-like DNA-binding protein